MRIANQSEGNGGSFQNILTQDKSTRALESQCQLKFSGQKLLKWTSVDFDNFVTWYFVCF